MKINNIDIILGLIFSTFTIYKFTEGDYITVVAITVLMLGNRSLIKIIKKKQKEINNLKKKN